MCSIKMVSITHAQAFANYSKSQTFVVMESKVTGFRKAMVGKLVTMAIKKTGMDAQVTARRLSLASSAQCGANPVKSFAGTAR